MSWVCSSLISNYTADELLHSKHFGVVRRLLNNKNTATFADFVFLKVTFSRCFRILQPFHESKSSHFHCVLKLDDQCLRRKLGTSFMPTNIWRILGLGKMECWVVVLSFFRTYNKMDRLIMWKKKQRWYEYSPSLYPGLPNTCSGLVFWVGFLGPNTSKPKVFGSLQPRNKTWPSLN